MISCIVVKFYTTNSYQQIHTKDYNLGLLFPGSFQIIKKLNEDNTVVQGVNTKLPLSPSLSINGYLICSYESVAVTSYYQLHKRLEKGGGGSVNLEKLASC